MAIALSQQEVVAVVCEGVEDARDPSQSCNGIVNSCTSSGLCVVGTDGNCCSFYTDEKEKSTCIAKELDGFAYINDCPSGTVGITSIGNDGSDTVGISALCSGTADKANFASSCGGLVDTCTTEGLCIVNQEGLCCPVYTDSDGEFVKVTPDCMPEGEYTNKCEAGVVAIASETTAPTNTPTTEPTGAPTKAPTTEPTKAPTKMPTQSPTPEESGCGRKDTTGFVLGSFIALFLASMTL